MTEQMMSQTRTVLEQIDREHLTNRLTTSGTLRASKPNTDADTGLTQYVWRMARFHSGADPSMPVTASFWLQSYLDDLGVDASVTGVTDDAGEEITDALDALTREILREMGYNPNRAAERWHKAGAF